MKYKIRITRQALHDMNDAASYIRTTLKSPEAADNLLIKARNEINSLESFPDRNQLIDDPLIASWGVRFLVVNNYLAFYVISESEKIVYVIRFLYGKRNWRSILKGDFFGDDSDSGE